MPFLVIMCELFNGVLQPREHMPAVWKYTMYYVGPFTYWVGGVLSTVLTGQPVVCDAHDLNYFTPPPSQTCGEYAGSWIASTTGYLVDPDSRSLCGYCQYSSADDVGFLPFIRLLSSGCLTNIHSISWGWIWIRPNPGRILVFLSDLSYRMFCWFLFWWRFTPGKSFPGRKGNSSRD